MEKEKKKLLIVDDTDIDRITLKSILCRDYDVVEAQSGNMACGTLATQGDELSAVLLDISMPDMDGFGVLKYMEEKHLDHLPVFLVTAEPTVNNVQRAMQHHIAEFIGKPFKREEVLRRLQSWLDITLEPDLKPAELDATRTYIADLEGIYQSYLANHGRNDVRCRIVSDLTRILLEDYNKNLREHRLNEVGMELVSRAAYFCDIGEMLIPCQWFQPMVGDPRYQELRRSHPLMGANLLRLNRDEHCAYFVELCADMCLHHHERFDGRGYPDRLSQQQISGWNQLCRLADEFELIRNGVYDKKDETISLVIKRLVDGGEGMVNPGLYGLLKNCEPQILEYFRKIYQGV